MSERIRIAERLADMEQLYNRMSRIRSELNSVGITKCALMAEHSLMCGHALCKIAKKIDFECEHSIKQVNRLKKMLEG